ncbi:hypothetical protein ONQ62_28290, partial [Salmonella enterica subsp. enterica serovar Virginia]|nr:hypothetical protein [Salmonella enterica subsp. enterica serovar Virginia]
TGCKTCELACKDYKDLTPDVSFRRIYEYAGGDWQEDNGVWHQSYVGAAMAGVPVIMVKNSWAWSGVYIYAVIAILLTTLSLALL